MCLYVNGKCISYHLFVDFQQAITSMGMRGWRARNDTLIFCEAVIDPRTFVKLKGPLKEWSGTNTTLDGTAEIQIAASLKKTNSLIEHLYDMNLKGDTDAHSLHCQESPKIRKTYRCFTPHLR